VFTEAGLDRRYYELCALTELRNALRAGDIWMPGSRQFKDFEDYLSEILIDSEYGRGIHLSLSPIENLGQRYCFCPGRDGGYRD
jgi:hypothetical protein